MKDYAELLNPALLVNEAVMDAALDVVRQDVTADNCMEIIEQILSAHRPQLIALLLSGLIPILPIDTWVLRGFPKKAIDYLESPLATLLTTLSEFFAFGIPLSENRELSLRSVDYYREASANCASIRALSSNLSDRESRPGNASNKRTSFKGTLSHSKANSSLSGGLAPEGELLDKQKHLLHCYLQLLRESEVRHEIKTVIIRDTQKSLPAALDIPRPATSAAEEDHQMEVPSESKPEPGLKPTQLDKGVDGFGMWQIVISSRAERDLREERRRNKKSCELIVKKIRDLSQGNFSGVNQRRINFSGDGIPIFQANATYHARLIYQVDCVADTETEEKQCIRIFGVYTPTEVKNGAWDTVGKQLAKKGQQYRHRCNTRLKSSSDRRYFIPAAFPPAAEELPVDSLVSDLLQVDNSPEFQTSLILQKFIPFSQVR